MKRYKIFNHSSEKMNELQNQSINLIITDPPWNMGVKFGKKINLQPREDYNKFISSIIKEMFRVIKPDGICVIVSAEKVKYDNKTTDLSKTYLKLFIEQDFNLISDIPIIFNESKESEWKAIPIKQWEIGLSNWAYSQEGKILIFSKDKSKNKKSFIDKIKNRIYNFESKEGHPCPSSIKIVKDLLDTFYNSKDKVLDPFMGTANLGVEVLKRNGLFFGYEIDKGFYLTAKQKLEKTDNLTK